MILVYLHGFASGPTGSKGTFCQTWARTHGIDFHAPDLNLPDFENLTIRAQVERVEGLLADLTEPPVVVGSSLGGLVAAAVAWRGAPVAHLVLLAPAFGFCRRRLVGPRWEGYRRRGHIPVFHHALGRWLRLGSSLLEDLPTWEDDAAWRLEAPITLLHGRHDEAVPIDESRDFIQRHPGARLLEVEDDHGLLLPESLSTLEGILDGVRLGG